MGDRADTDRETQWGINTLILEYMNSANKRFHKIYDYMFEICERLESARDDVKALTTRVEALEQKTIFVAQPASNLPPFPLQASGISKQGE